MVVGDYIGVPVFGFVHLQVGVLPSELLTRVNGLEGRGGKKGNLGTVNDLC